MAGWNCTPLKAPLVPKTRLVPLPENTRRIDLGFPPPSHAHLNQRVLTRNEELPRPQLYPDDFRNVLRKKHAAGRRLSGGMRFAKVKIPFAHQFVTNNGHCNCERRRFCGSFGSSSATRRQTAGKARTEACFCAFCPSDRQQLASRFWQPAFVIARSGSDEAIQLLSNFWIASIHSQ
jgi:hypothetical protein